MREQVEKILHRVQKPARYTGNEWNAVKKEWQDKTVKMVFAFPDVYEVGMSYLGLQILYHIVNKRSDSLMERAFAPWVDMEQELRERGIPLFSMESFRPLNEFDIIAFTLQYELSYTNILNMLDLSGVTLGSSERDEREPLVIAGGPCVFNPEPLADFVDLFVIGEGEEVIHELIEAFKIKKQNKLSKHEFLRKAASIQGIYVPSFYRPRYDNEGNFQRLDALLPEARPRITKRAVQNIDTVDFPTHPIVPWMEVIHDRVMLEVMRGCTRGCRFCQAGVLYRPAREKKPETLIRQAGEIVKTTGYNEISLTSLSSADYTGIKEVIKGLLNAHAADGIGISLPSLRVDAFSLELAREIQRVRRSSLTFAPEAGTQRMRDVINKGVTEKDIIETVTSAFQAGWNAIKLYFMIGLPTETGEDVGEIAALAKRVLDIGQKYATSKRRLKVTVSVSSFVPKAHSCFQWEPLEQIGKLKEKQSFLASKMRGRGLIFNYHSVENSYLEAVFARGDRRLGRVLRQAWRLGCKFDGWTELFDYGRWQEAFRLEGVEPEYFAYRRFDYEDPLPWGHIASGVGRKFLAREHQRALKGETTMDCRQGTCHGCGLCPTLETEPEILGVEIDAQI